MWNFNFILNHKIQQLFVEIILMTSRENTLIENNWEETKKKIIWFDI